MSDIDWVIKDPMSDLEWVIKAPMSDLDWVITLDCLERIAGVDCPHESVPRLDLYDVIDRSNVQLGCQARHQTLAQRRGSS